eukprot:CAMPEP_0198688052 /NCGR_PEP_ID=MMETSP1468-20131203/89171_1 /TAXON_ID=1461545 /ORGANISM="Mantoniella sp, Strain CCMP1436" /LENGTH=167 /DNA_ID=CAMNT_0044437079 /DNA_START=382 /DNA_END=882 /DNA_ORIENTATION=-
MAEHVSASLQLVQVFVLPADGTLRLVLLRDGSDSISAPDLRSHGAKRVAAPKMYRERKLRRRLLARPARLHDADPTPAGGTLRIPVPFWVCPVDGVRAVSTRARLVLVALAVALFETLPQSVRRTRVQGRSHHSARDSRPRLPRTDASSVPEVPTSSQPPLRKGAFL